jgi:hypothetical protein
MAFVFLRLSIAWEFWRQRLGSDFSDGVYPSNNLQQVVARSISIRTRGVAVAELNVF